jgi:hypothetical protein
MRGKYVVITSIFPPTEAIERFSRLPGWQLLVVADRKTDPTWSFENVELVSVREQEQLAAPLARALPWNTYTRKNIGYFIAISRGAQVVYDTDDDNVPLDNWILEPAFEGEHDVLSGAGYVNAYSLFTDKHVWPRGYPLPRILKKEAYTVAKASARVGVWQYLADEDPDVDAIYRLTDNTPIYFRKRSPLVLDEGVVCPFNSQNTYFRREAFPLLYLPSTVTFRFTDIVRGLVAQPVLWAAGYRLGFGEATVIQRRNPHDYLRDFESEVPVYLLSENVVAAARRSVDAARSIPENLVRVYEELAREKVVMPEELRLLDLWLTGIAQA